MVYKSFNESHVKITGGMASASVIDTRNVRKGFEIPSEHLAGWNPEHVKQVLFYINADVHDEEDVASGTLAIHNLNAPVRVETIPASAFQYLVVVPINDHRSKPNGWTDADFAHAQDAIQKAAPQESANPPLLSRRDADTNGDAEAWSPELGKDDAFAGVFKMIRANHRDADYFIAVKAGVPKACAQLKEAILQEGKGYTYEKLLNDPRVHYVQHLAQRNAKRLAYQIASNLHIADAVHAVEDVSAYTPSQFMAKPMRAEPSARRGLSSARSGLIQSISSIQPVQYGRDECVGVFHRVRPTTEAIKQNAVVGSPYDGIHLFSMDKKPIGVGIPADIGKRAPLDDADLEHRDTSRRHANVVWEGPQQALKVMAPNVYHDIDDEFYRGMSQMGWVQQGTNRVSHMIPVLLKVSNMDLKNK